MCAVVCAGCSFKAPAGGGGPFDAAVDALVIPPGPCETVPQSTCSDADTLRECKVQGANPVDTVCPLGCSIANGAHCQTVVPAGGGASAMDLLPDAQLEQVTLSGTRTIINGDTGEIAMGQFTRDAGTGVIAGVDFHVANGIAVFRFKSLTIDGAVGLQGTHAIALVADGDIRVNTLVDAHGGCTNANDAKAGPGGFAGGGPKLVGSGDGGGAAAVGGAADCSGGGGGGHGDTGGQGGKSGGPAGGANPAGGPPFGDAVITLLVGGAGGGGGGGGGKATTGGGGGGAIQLVSNNTIRIDGTLDAGGCGGTGDGDGGSGGGAGGTILLEAATVDVRGTLAVNGGAGGSSNIGPTRSPAGDASTTAATAPSGGSNGAAGGDGGAAASSVGGPGGDGNQKGAGGGGAAGWIRLNGRSVTTNQGTISPPIGSASSTQGMPKTQ